MGFEYNGATGRNLGLGGSNDGTLNINQLDPSHLALGSAALAAQVPNPFAGLMPGTSLNGATISRAQSLRPFPQFQNIIMRQTTAGENQYHAAILKLEKRMRNGWGGRLNYTYSRLNDNQFGEGNSYSATNGNAQNAYDLEAEYGISLLDVPHKLVFSPTVELPFGEGKRWAQSGFGAYVLGDWTISSIVAFESGFPISVSQNSNGITSAFFLMQRPNSTSTDPATSGEREDRSVLGGRDAIEPRCVAELGRICGPGFRVGEQPENSGQHPDAASQQLGLRRREGPSPRWQSPRTDQVRGAQYHQHREDGRPDHDGGQCRFRPHYSAARLHAPDAADVPVVVLS